MKWKKQTCTLLIFTLVLSMTMISVGAPQLPKFFVDPPKYTATQPGEVFTININVDNIQDLTGFEFKLSYNTTLLDTVEAAVGPFPPRPLIWRLIEVNETAGYIFILAVFHTVDGSGTLATITFNAVYPSSASCTLHLYETYLFDSAGKPITHQVQDGYYEYVILSLTVATDKPTYLRKENVQIQGNLTLDNSPYEGLAALEVDDPANYGMIRRTIQMGPPPPPGEITIIDVIPCDMSGHPMQNFMIGTLSYFNVTVRNSGTEWKDVAITANSYDGEMAPLGAPTLLARIAPGTSSLMFCIDIESWAHPGTARVYASVFTDLPRAGGVPLCPGKSANYTIIGGTGTLPPETQNPGNFTLIFKLPPDAPVGVWRVYVSACYLKQYVMDDTLFGVNTICVPDHYPTIQQAVDAATPTNNTIIVGRGTYNEHVNIYKSLTLLGVTPTKTIINGGGTGTVVTVTANNVKMSRFTIKNGGSSNSGVALIGSSGSTISKNIITSNGYGIYLNHSTSITLEDNTMICNKYNFGVFGDSISHFTHEIDTTNTVDGKPIIYWINKQNSQIPSNAGFIAIVNSTEIVVRDLDLTKEGQGIMLAFTNDSLIERTDTTNNKYGIYMIHSHNNRIVGSTASRNTVGIYQSYCNGNIICHNNFINNTNQAKLYQSSNTWNDSGGKGNYWSNYTGVDDGSNNRTPGDGVGDTLLPHQGVDWYPLINPWILVHDVATTGVTPLIPQNATLYVGSLIIITVTLKDEGDFTESLVQITAYYNGNTIETKILPELTPQGETDLNFTWDTEDLSPGNYNISAQADAVTGETDTTDNMCIDGNVTLLAPTIHDIAIISVTPQLPYDTGHAYRCWVVNVAVFVENQGQFRETVNVTAYYDSTEIQTQTVTLYPVTNITLIFAWNIAEVTPHFNYTISANISSVIQGEVDTDDNMLVDGEVQVRKCGDLNYDNKVGAADIILLGKSILKNPGQPGFNPYADLNRDYKVGAADIILLGKNILR